MTVVKEEIFGPVVVVMKFKDEKEAIRLANDTDFGLGSAVWSKDGARATRVANQIQAGIVMINCPFSAFPGTPFGGYKQSGFGRELVYRNAGSLFRNEKYSILLRKSPTESLRTVKIK